MNIRSLIKKEIKCFLDKIEYDNELGTKTETYHLVPKPRSSFGVGGGNYYIKEYLDLINKDNKEIDNIINSYKSYLRKGETTRYSTKEDLIESIFALTAQKKENEKLLKKTKSDKKKIDSIGKQVTKRQKSMKKLQEQTKNIKKKKKEINKQLELKPTKKKLIKELDNIKKSSQDINKKKKKIKKEMEDLLAKSDRLIEPYYHGHHDKFGGRFKSRYEL